MSNSNAHNHFPLPNLVVGGATGRHTGGRHLKYPDHTPMTNLILSMLDKVGVPMDTLGDSTGRIGGGVEVGLRHEVGSRYGLGCSCRRNSFGMLAAARSVRLRWRVDIRCSSSASASGCDGFAEAGRIAGSPDRRGRQGGDQAAVTTLLRQRVNVNTPEPDGTTALHWAVREDDLALADKLIRAGADVKAANRYGVTAVYLAAVNGNAAMIERLFKAGVDANVAGPEGETALMTAARTGKVEAADVLLAHGAVVDAREELARPDRADVGGRRAASGDDARPHRAWRRRQRALEPGEVGTADDRGAEGKMAAPGQHDAPALREPRRLRRVRDDPRRGERGSQRRRSRRHQPDSSRRSSTATTTSRDVLIDKGADVNLADKTGRTPLYAAVDDHTMPYSNRPSPKESDEELTSLDIVKRLLARGANVNARLKNGTALSHEGRSRQRHDADHRHDARCSARPRPATSSWCVSCWRTAPTRT